MHEDPFLQPPPSLIQSSPRKSSMDSGPREYDIEIEGGFDPTLPTVMCVSLRQVYGSGAIFKAIFKKLYQLGANILLVIPDTLEEHNFRVEFNDNAHPTEKAIAPLVSARLKESWIEVNLHSDPEMRHICEAMTKEGKLRILDWEECKKEFKAEFEKAAKELSERFQQKDTYYQETNAVAESFYLKAKEKHDPTNPMFQAARLKGDDDVKEKYWEYSNEECYMARAFELAGYKQHLYPNDYHQRFRGKDPKANIDLFQCLSAGSDSTMKKQNIRITERNSASASKQERRKASLDAKLIEQQDFIAKLKADKNRLQSDAGNARAKLTLLGKELEETKKRLKEHDLTSLENQEKAHELEEEISRRTAEIKDLEEKMYEREKRLETYNNAILALQKELHDRVNSAVWAHESDFNIMADIQKELLRRIEDTVWAHESDFEITSEILLESLEKKKQVEKEADAMRKKLVATAATLDKLRVELKDQGSSLNARKRTLDKKELIQEIREKELNKREAALALKEQELAKREAALKLQKKEMEKQKFKEESSTLGRRIARTLFCNPKKRDIPDRSGSVSPLFHTENPPARGETILNSPQPQRHAFLRMFDFIQPERPRSATCAPVKEKTPEGTFSEERLVYKNRQASVPELKEKSHFSY